MYQIAVISSKGGTGKSTMVASLSDVLKSDVIDHDPQGTITVSSLFTGKRKPVNFSQITKDVVIHDTPPFNDIKNISLAKDVDIIIVPTKINYPDLLAFKATYDLLIKTKTIDKAILVFNEVRKPHNKTYFEVKSLYKKNYPKIRIAGTEISNLVSFSRVLAENISGKALQQMEILVKELNISKKYLK